jgi:hypothetical protein
LPVDVGVRRGSSIADIPPCVHCSVGVGCDPLTYVAGGIALMARCRRTLILLLSFALYLASQTGCAALTDSQVEEVAHFAKVTKHYTALPGPVIKALNEVTVADDLLVVSVQSFNSDKSINDAWEDIKTAYKWEQQFQDQAERADQGVAVLDTYAELLATLSSDTYTQALDKSANEAGRSVDREIQKYKNKMPVKSADLKSIGSAVSQAVSGAGGYFLDRKRAELLKLCVTQFNPVVLQITNDLLGMMAEIRVEADSLEEIMKANFKNAADRTKMLPLSTVVSVGEAIKSLNRVRRLSAAVGSAARAYAMAHQMLVDALAERRELSERIAQIAALESEIKTADKLERQLEK